MEEKTMKSIKRFLLLILALTMLVMSFALTSCGDDGDEGDGGSSDNGGSGDSGSGDSGSSACQHTYGAWSQTTAPTCTTAGVESRTCSKCQAPETRPVAALGHNGDLVCEVCYATVFKVTEVDFSQYKSVGLEIKDYVLNLNYADEDYRDQPQEMTMSIDVIEGYVGLDENDALIGAGKGVMKTVGTNTGVNSTVEITFVIDGGVFYAAITGDAPDVTATIKENHYAKIDLNPEATPELAEIEEILEQVEALVPVIEEWYNEELAPIFANVEINTDGAKKYAAKLANALLKKTVADDGSYTLTIDFEAIKAFNNDLATKKISAIIDVLLGEGVYADVKAFINSDEFYSLSVADVIDYIEDEQGVDLAAFFSAVNSLLATLTENEEMTFEKFLIQSGEFDGMIDENFNVVEFLRSEEMAEFSVMAALKTFIPAEDDPATEDVDEAAAAVKQAVAGIFTQLEELTVYDILLAGGSNGEQVGPNPGAAPASEDDPIAEMVAEINAMIDMISEMTGITINVDKDGNYVSTVVKVTASAPTLTLTANITITTADVTVDMAFEGNMEDAMPEFECEMKVLPGKTVAIEAAKVAAIKAVFDSVPEISNNDFFEITKQNNDEFKDGRNNVILYTEGDTIYAIHIDNITVKGNDATINVTIYKVSNEYNALTVTSGCTNCIYVDLEATVYAANGQFDAQQIDIFGGDENNCDIAFIKTHYLNTGAGVSNIQAVLNSADKNDAWSEDYGSFCFLYNTAEEEYVSYGYAGYFGNNDEEISYNGHHFVLDATKSEEPDDYCTDMGKAHYKCTICNVEYDYYYVNGHSFWGNEVYTPVTSGSLADGFKKKQICVEEDCGEISVEDHTIYVDSELTATYYEYNANYADFKITVAQAGTYVFYTDSESDDYCDTAVRIWKVVDADTVNDVAYEDNGGENNHCYLSINLEAGEYIIGVKDFSVNVDSYTLHVEAAN
jgi:hypothetical protein